jgi:hypothetical protein
MSSPHEANISSFLIRFVDPDRAGPSYRGVIRHIQSGDELSFTRWVEATDFIQRFFPLVDLDPRPMPDNGGITQD